MGNTASSTESDDDLLTNFKEDDTSSDGELENDKDPFPSIDLQSLFEHASLRASAAKVRDDMPENVVQQHQAHLLSWLEERQKRNEDTVTLAQFCDVLMSRSVGREDAIQAFQQFDTEGDGSSDVSAMMEALKNSNSADMAGELGYIVRTLQACSLTPGFIDVYNEDKQAVGQHGTRILNFLLRNRAPSSSLPFPILNGFNNTVNMRLSTVKSHFNKLKDVASRQQVASMLNEGEEMKTITRCWKSIEVSTNKNDAYRLTNSDFSSVWQSDGSARSHWIRLRMRNNVVIKQLSVYVAASDQSYMPQLIVVAVGKNAHSLHEIKEVRIHSHITGEVVLLENVKTYYPIIQINIKRCHSDGCDTRIHEIKTLGYRITKESTVSVMDASASWFLQVLASTATAAIPISPGLRASILQHSKAALQYMVPLSLCPASSDRPQVLSAHVLKEVDRFLTDISGDECLEVQDEALYVMLAFNLACGHVAGTLRALQCLQEHKGFKLEASKLLQSLNTVRNTFWKKQSSLVQMTLAGCDGGQKEETSGPQNVLSGNWTTAQAYLTGDGKVRVNMFFKASDHVQVTKIRFKVDKGPRGPKHGMVFVFNLQEPFDLNKQVEAFKKYDSWTPTSFALASKCKSAGIPTKDVGGPLAFFTLEDDWDETEVVMDSCPIGQYILIKFLEPRNPSAERLGIVGIKFHGFHRKRVFVDNSHLYEQFKIPPEPEYVDSDVVFFWTLDFLVSLSRDHVPPKADNASSKALSLDMSGVSVDQMWELYTKFSNRIHQNLVLQLLHSLFPFLIGNSENTRHHSETLFKHLCLLVDCPPKFADGVTEDHLLSIVRQVIIDGAAVFFPDKEARRKQLFNMMTDINGTAEVPSVSLVFQSLCQFFGSVDPSGLLDLPITVEKGYDPSPVLAVMETLVSVAGRELLRVLEQTEVSTQASHLGQLLCSLQTALLCWCHRQMSSSEKEHSNIAQDVLVRYVLLLVNKASQACQDFRKKTQEERAAVISKLEGTFLSTTVRQMVLIVMLLGDELSPSTHVSLLKLLMPLAQELHKIELLMSDYFYPVDSSHWDEMGGSDVVLRTWEVESAHNYENNVHTIQIFSCPGAATFTVEFDPRCETEKRYDYLEFTDSRGSKMRFDQKVGTDKWPVTITFKSGHRLQFHFHSDSSNNEWGYKFKVIATGTPDVPLCWMFDLHLSLAELLGQLCGATLNCSTGVVKKPASGDEQEAAEAELLRSDLWTTLFRGGYRIGKLQWSLSHRFMAVEDSGLLDMLWAMVGNEESGNGAILLRRCREQVTGLQIGGAAMDNAVVAVFCALLWHTQLLREELEKIEDGKFEDCTLSDGIVQAYNIAHSVRQMLMVQRQNMKAAAEKSGEDVDADEPVRQYTEKALFLLKFAGLQRVHIKSESKPKLSRQSSRFTRLPRGIKTGNMESSMDKYPSFRLVLEFVRDPAWRRDRVEELLKERTQRATAVSEVYLFASEYIRTMSNVHVFQVPVVLFLQHLLKYQSGFSQHYADGLDGCGLEQEGRVRQTFYTFVRGLVEAIRNVTRAQLQKPVMAAYDYIQACTLHLLDINWQMYDLAFLVDIKLPDLYMKLAKGSVSMREKIVGEADKDSELVEYKKDMGWLAECKKDFMKWYKNTPSGKDSKKAMQMFVAKFCDLLEVEVNCDGCSVMLPGRRYRCLQCEDMDLCTMCYAGGVKPGGEHTDDHEIVHMMYKCDECQGFIVGTRLHCRECEDFDLCLGCHEERHFPAGHSPDHEMETFPLVKLKLNKDSDSALQSYLHQHVWLLFASMSLSMAAVMYRDGSRGGAEVHSDYIKACTQLHNMCLEMSTSCLRKVTSQTDEQEVDDAPELLELRQEEAFASHAQERVMGLLGAMIPPENKVAISTEVNYTFTSENFLQLLFQIASGESGHETNTQHLAMGLVGQLLQRSTTSCSSVDTAVAMATSKPIPEESPAGAHTAEYLFSFGATCLERSGLEWANSMASILQKMFKSPSWKEVLLGHLSTSIRRLKLVSTESSQSLCGPDTTADQTRFEAMFKKTDVDNKGYITKVQLKELLQPLINTEWKSFWMISRCVRLRRSEAMLRSPQTDRKQNNAEQIADSEQLGSQQFAFIMTLVESRYGPISALPRDTIDSADRKATSNESPLKNNPAQTEGNPKTMPQRTEVKPEAVVKDQPKTTPAEVKPEDKAAVADQPKATPAEVKPEAPVTDQPKTTLAEVKPEAPVTDQPKTTPAEVKPEDKAAVADQPKATPAEVKPEDKAPVMDQSKSTPAEVKPEDKAAVADQPKTTPAEVKPEDKAAVADQPKATPAEVKPEDKAAVADQPKTTPAEVKPEAPVTDQPKTTPAEVKPEAPVTDQSTTTSAEVKPEAPVTDQPVTTPAEVKPEAPVTDQSKSTLAEVKPEVPVTDQPKTTPPEVKPEAPVTDQPKTTPAEVKPETPVTDHPKTTPAEVNPEDKAAVADQSTTTPAEVKPEAPVTDQPKTTPAEVKPETPVTDQPKTTPAEVNPEDKAAVADQSTTTPAEVKPEAPVTDQPKTTPAEVKPEAPVTDQSTTTPAEVNPEDKAAVADQPKTTPAVASTEANSTENKGTTIQVRQIGKGAMPTILKKSTNGPELSSIFALFVIAGFPEVLSIGAPVRYTDFSTEFKKGVVLKHFPDKYQTLLVDRKTRRRKTKKDEYVECESHDLQVLDQQHICAFIEVIKDFTAKVRQGACVSVENVWVGSLALKALLKTLQSGLDDHVPELYTTEFVQATIYLASQGTGFSRQWLLKDLEILSLMLYTRDQEKEESTEQNDKKKSSEKEEASSSEENGQDPWQGLDDAAKHTFKTLHGHLDIPVAILRAIYDMHDQDANALIMAVHESASYTGVFVPSDEVKKLARKWEVKCTSTNMVDKSLDTGMQLTTIRPLTDRTVEEADEEASEESQKLISAVDADMSCEAVKQRKSRSALMLKKELEMQGKAGSRDFLLKINMAMAVLYARHVLMKLLADWPASIPLHIGCRDDVQVPFILDLLNRYDTQDTFQKVVRNVISCYSADCVVPIAMAACQFLEEVNVSSVTKESEHQYKNNTRTEEKVSIPGVAFISIHFDNKCATEEGCDELVMASTSDYTQSRRVFSGPREHWIDFDIPGDTVYYKFESDGSNTDWGFKFTVTGRKIGRFDTGYMILKSIFAMPRVTERLPLKDLWSSLVFVACKQTGQQRLKALHLTLKILQSQFKCTGSSQLAVDLGLLQPLWKLYNKLGSSDMDVSTIVPPVVRALTEVFLVAENLAMEWDVSQQYMATLVSKEDIRRIVFEGIRNIAAVSLAIGVTNKATEGLKALEVNSKKDN